MVSYTHYEDKDPFDKFVAEYLPSKCIGMIMFTNFNLNCLQKCVSKKVRVIHYWRDKQGHFHHTPVLFFFFIVYHLSFRWQLTPKMTTMFPSNGVNTASGSDTAKSYR